MPTAACPGDNKESAAAEQAHSSTCPSHNTRDSKPLRNQFGYLECSSGQTFSIIILVTLKLSVTCMSQKQFNPFSTDLNFSQEKKK